MEKTLGIYVTSNRHMGQLIKVCKAAKEKGVAVKVFFTHEGTRLCTDPQMSELAGYVKLALCKVGFESLELDKSETDLDSNAYSSQSWHAEMIYDCDRYLTF